MVSNELQSLNAHQTTVAGCILLQILWGWIVQGVTPEPKPQLVGRVQGPECSPSRGPRPTEEATGYVGSRWTAIQALRKAARGGPVQKPLKWSSALGAEGAEPDGHPFTSVGHQSSGETAHHRLGPKEDLSLG